MNPRRDAFPFKGLIKGPGGFLTGNQAMKIDFFGSQGFEQQALELLLFLAIDHAAPARVRHVKSIEHNAVRACENLRAQNINAGRAEGTRDFAEESCSIPSADFARGVAAVRLIVPGKDRFQRLVFLSHLMMHEAMGLRDIVDDLFDRMNLKVAWRQAGKMSFN